MFVDDLFGNYRKTEPTRLLLLRAFIVIVLVAGLTGYITALVIEIAGETPTVKVSSSVAEYLPIPDAIFTMTSAFALTCSIKKNDGQTQDCGSYLSQPVEKNGKYYGSFTAKNDFTFVPKRKDSSAILSFEFNLTSSNHDGNDVEVTFIDSEKNPIVVELASEVTDEMLQTLDESTQEILRTNLYYLANYARTNIKFSRNIREKIKPKFTDVLGISSAQLDRQPFITSNLQKNPIVVELASEVTDEMLQTLDESTQEILRTNLYYLANYARTNIKFSRNIREKIKPKFTDVLGISSAQLDRQPFITSNLQYLPLSTGSSNSYLGIVIVEPQNFIVETKTDVRNRTILSALGVMGGAWSLSIALYSLFFGSDTIRPFGCVQCLPCIKSASRKKLRDRLPIIPLVEEKFISPNSDVKHRIDALEVFLREYVVDAGVLNEMAKKEAESDHHNHQPQYTPSYNNGYVQPQQQYNYQ
ncbi:hypothetical protein Glove_146g63 [Diversispora epigaea]|uniref:Uncharacterized protein n=1 Tax=Diversispora epigaea TaxID=1348612 RepID=A0A397J2U3_9GLOM|nr:hypothetical protein Glove_146g63 [Diversispora epigaea]